MPNDTAADVPATSHSPVSDAGTSPPSAANLPELTGKVYAILEPLASGDRLRVVHAALTLLGEGLPAPLSSAVKTPGGRGVSSGEIKSDEGDLEGLPPEARKWLQRSGLSMDDLNHFFHFDNEKVTVIASPLESKTKKEQTIGAYLLRGVAALLETGAASFQDDEARSVCEHLGCLDKPNHSRITQGFGNKIAGSKEAGWRLTQPGLNAAAEMLKQSQNH
jgi:hypothetical protein